MVMSLLVCADDFVLSLTLRLLYFDGYEVRCFVGFLRVLSDQVLHVFR